MFNINYICLWLGDSDPFWTICGYPVSFWSGQFLLFLSRFGSLLKDLSHCGPDLMISFILIHFWWFCPILNYLCRFSSIVSATFLLLLSQSSSFLKRFASLWSRISDYDPCWSVAIFSQCIAVRCPILIFFSCFLFNRNFSMILFHFSSLLVLYFGLIFEL